jgi:hypothetical protein
MMDTTMSPIELAERLVLLLALALFFGLAFEEVYKRDEPEVPGGIRTFPMVALAGACSTWSSRTTPWPSSAVSWLWRHGSTPS